jgi:hypothetical protein
MLNAAPTETKGKNNDKTELTDAQKARVTEMENRLEEIKGMDFQSMSKAEKNDVKMEMKEMKAEARATGNGIYLSIGAVIVIVLLLILLT